MDNPFREIASAVRDAQELDRAVESSANSMADLLTGKLRSVSTYRLAKLKRELAQFDAKTKVWKS